MTAWEVVGQGLLFLLLGALGLVAIILGWGLLVAAYRTTKEVRPAHRHFAEAIIKEARLADGGTVPANLILREAYRQGLLPDWADS